MIIDQANRLEHIETYYFARKLGEIRQLNAAGKNIINLGIGSPDLLPHPTVIEALKSASDSLTANKYQSYKGLPVLRSAFADFNKKQFDVNLNPEKEILPLIGSKEGIMHISMSFLNPGDQVLVPNPGYPAYAACAKIAQAEMINFQLEEKLNWRPDLDKLAKTDLTRAKLMWINYPNMPTGAKADKGFFKEVVTFGKAHNIMICHDNPYTFILNDDPISMLEIEGASNNYLELQSLSKNFNMAGWRVGAVLAGEEIINTVMKFKSNMDSGMYYGVQHAAVAALNLDDNWFAQNNEIYTRRRKLVWQIMDLLECQYSKDTAGLFVWGKIPKAAKNAKSFADEILYNANVFAAPGFIFGDAGDQYIRFSLCAEEALLEEALERIDKHLILAKSIA